MTERLLPIFNEQNVMRINMCQRLLSEGINSCLNQSSENAGHRVAQANEFRKVEHHVFGSQK